MAAASFQLFPPPRGRRQTSSARRPSLHTKMPAPQRSDSATSVHAESELVPDFHELVVEVDPQPASSANQIVAPAAPPRVHTRAAPSQQRTAPPQMHRKESVSRARDPRAPMSKAPAQDVQQSCVADVSRAISPAFSSASTLVRANSTATRGENVSPHEEIPMRSMFPVYDPTIPLASQLYKPTQASPTQLPRTQISRSPYSPDSYVPHHNVLMDGSVALPPPTRLFFTPSSLLDNLWLAANGQAEPSVQVYTLRMHRATVANPTVTFGTTLSLPFYSLAQSSPAAGHEVPSMTNKLFIQRHHPTQPRILPIAHLDLIPPPSLDNVMFDPQQQEPTTLLTSIYPKLAALQALDTAANSPAASRVALSDPSAQSPTAKRFPDDILVEAAQRESCALVWTKDDPQQQTNPWAQHIPSEGSYKLHHPILGSFPISIEGDCSDINAPSTRPVTAMYSHNAPVTPHIPGRKTACITLLNPYVLSSSTPRTNSSAPLSLPSQFDGINRPISLTPSELPVGQLPTTTDATADDSMLARLDFSNDALVLNVAAITRFGNPFLVDVVASTLLAVAVAEATRGRKAKNRSQENFEPPPPNLVSTHQKHDATKSSKDSFLDGFRGFGRKSKRQMSGKSIKKSVFSMKSTTSRNEDAGLDKDIELGEWYGQNNSQIMVNKNNLKKKAQKQHEDKEKLPFVARSLIGVLTFMFKTILWILELTIKVIVGFFVRITRNLSKP